MKMSEIKISIEYNPNDPEHLRSMKRFLKASEMANALWDVRDLWRKYKHEDLTEDQWKIVDEYTDRIRDILIDRGIFLDDLLN
jgi:hypothetical protein